MTNYKKYLNSLKKDVSFLYPYNIISELDIPYFGYYLDEDNFPELKCFYSDYTWICTDTRVGLKFYFYEDELICASFQKGRKSEEVFYWVSKDYAIKTRNYLLEKLVFLSQQEYLEKNVNLFEEIEIK